MDSLLIFLLASLAFCPTVILFGPILFRIIRTKEFNFKQDAISTLRDFDTTKAGFLIWMSLYLISQVTYMLLALPYVVEIPTILYILGFGSLLFGIAAFFFLSTTLKHITLGSLSALCTASSLVGLGVTLYKVDLFLALISGLVALATILVLLVIALKKMRMWLAEYLALGALALWNLAILIKIVSKI